MRKTLTSLLLACALLLSCMPALSEAASQAGENFVMAGFDGDSVQHDWNTNLFFQRMQERTGISFTFRQFTDYAAWSAEKARLFAGDDLPDVLFKAELTPQETVSYYESGKLIDLKPYLAENAPNLTALFAKHPDWEKAVTLADGAIVALPALDSLHTQNAMWINKTWLEALKLDMPTDAASLINVLTAFKNDDPNRNGKKDEIPFTFLGPWDLKFLAHAFGQIANDYNVYADGAGKVHFMAAEDTYREFVAWAAELYQKGLLDKNGFSTADALRTVTDEKAAAVYGVFFANKSTAFLTSALGSQYTVLQPLSWEGTQTYRDFLGPVTRGTFAITSACKDPAALIRWVDSLYGEEGGVLALFGLEGTEYAYNENGTWRFLGATEELTSILQNATICDSGFLPWLDPVDFQLKHEDQNTTALIRSLLELNQIAVLPFPYYTLTAQEQAYIDPLQMALGTFVDESLARFVTGETPLDDASWQEYLSNLDQMGLPDFTAFWQQVLDGQAR